MSAIRQSDYRLGGYTEQSPVTQPSDQPERNYTREGDEAGLDA